MYQYLLPSKTPEFVQKHQAYLDAGTQTKEDLDNERNCVLWMLKAVKEDMKSKQSSFNTKPEKTPGGPAVASIIAEVDKYGELLKTYSALRGRLDQIDRHLEQVSDKFRTSVCHENTGFYGLADWAKQALTIYEHLCDGIGGASVFGAGITYTTIFRYVGSDYSVEVAS